MDQVSTAEGAGDRDRCTQALVAAAAAHDLVEALSRELAVQREKADRLEAEVAALRTTRLFRYTSGMRSVYGRLRAPS